MSVVFLPPILLGAVDVPAETSDEASADSATLTLADSVADLVESAQSCLVPAWDPTSSASCKAGVCMTRVAGEVDSDDTSNLALEPFHGPDAACRQ